MHRTGIASGQLPEFIRNDQWLPNSPEPWTIMTGVQCWRPITRSIQNPSESLNSKKCCRWSGTAATWTDQQGW